MQFRWAPLVSGLATIDLFRAAPTFHPLVRAQLVVTGVAIEWAVRCGGRRWWGRRRRRRRGRGRRASTAGMVATPSTLDWSPHRWVTPHAMVVYNVDRRC